MRADIPFEKQLALLAGLPCNIAADIWPNGAILHCHHCGRDEHVSSDEAGKYLTSGWPKCHDATMGVRPAERDRHA